MSANFYELLKYSQTGIASPDMTYFDKLRASTLMGGAVQTLTGIPPLSFKSDGTPLISWSMKGNGQQTGAPTPDNPVMPEFVGVKTANLFDVSSIVAGRINGTTGNIEYSSGTTIHDASISSITFSTSAPWRGFTTDFIQTTTKLTGSIGSFVGGDGATLTAYQYAYAQDKSFLGFIVAGSNAPEGTQYIRVSYQCTVIVTNAVATNIMLNSGRTALPYEPFGWAVPITCAGQTVPVYLGEVPTVRRVRKLVLTGTTADGNSNITAAGIIYITPTATLKTVGAAYCTHFKYVNQGQGANMPSNSFTTSGGADTSLWFKTDYTTVADFKAYLASEYAAGHPVTVWYVLANEQTGIVNEPLAKIGDYADELSSEDASVTISTVKGQNTLTVDTELQPSEMTITFKG